MKLRQSSILTSCAVLLVAWSLPGAQTAGQAAGRAGGTPPQYPTAGTQSPGGPGGPAATETPDTTNPSSTSARNKADQKEKHWSGTLVDVSCMAKELSATSSAPAQQPTTTAPAGVPHFASPASDSEGTPQQPGGQPGGAGMGPGAGSPNPGPAMPGSAGNPTGPDLSGPSAAQIARAARIDKATKQCPASSSTQMFGLSMAGGQVVQFDRDGDARAAEALKGASVQPGKKVKAKVTGVMADANTVKVASVEVKGKHSQQGPSASSSGSGL